MENKNGNYYNGSYRGSNAETVLLLWNCYPDHCYTRTSNATTEPEQPMGFSKEGRIGGKTRKLWGPPFRIKRLQGFKASGNQLWLYMFANWATEDVQIRISSVRG